MPQNPSERHVHHCFLDESDMTVKAVILSSMSCQQMNSYSTPPTLDEYIIRYLSLFPVDNVEMSWKTMWRCHDILY